MTKVNRNLLIEISYPNLIRLLMQRKTKHYQFFDFLNSHKTNLHKAENFLYFIKTFCFRINFVPVLRIKGDDLYLDEYYSGGGSDSIVFGHHSQKFYKYPSSFNLETNIRAYSPTEDFSQIVSMFLLNNRFMVTSHYREDISSDLNALIAETIRKAVQNDMVDIDSTREFIEGSILISDLDDVVTTFSELEMLRHNFCENEFVNIIKEGHENVKVVQQFRSETINYTEARVKYKDGAKCTKHVSLTPDIVAFFPDEIKVYEITCSATKSIKMQKSLKYLELSAHMENHYNLPVEVEVIVFSEKMIEDLKMSSNFRYMFRLFNSKLDECRTSKKFVKAELKSSPVNEQLKCAADSIGCIDEERPYVDKLFHSNEDYNKYMNGELFPSLKTEKGKEFYEKCLKHLVDESEVLEEFSTKDSIKAAVLDLKRQYQKVECRDSKESDTNMLLFNIPSEIRDNGKGKFDTMWTVNKIFEEISILSCVPDKVQRLNDFFSDALDVRLEMLNLGGKKSECCLSILNKGINHTKRAFDEETFSESLSICKSLGVKEKNTFSERRRINELYNFNMKEKLPKNEKPLSVNMDTTKVDLLIKHMCTRKDISGYDLLVNMSQFPVECFFNTMKKQIEHMKEIEGDHLGMNICVMLKNLDHIIHTLHIMCCNKYSKRNRISLDNCGFKEFLLISLSGESFVTSNSSRTFFSISLNNDCPDKGKNNEIFGDYVLNGPFSIDKYKASHLLGIFSKFKQQIFYIHNEINFCMSEEDVLHYYGIRPLMMLTNDRTISDFIGNERYLFMGLTSKRSNIGDFIKNKMKINLWKGLHVFFVNMMFKNLDSFIEDMKFEVEQEDEIESTVSSKRLFSYGSNCNVKEVISGLYDSYLTSKQRMHDFHSLVKAMDKIGETLDLWDDCLKEASFHTMLKGYSSSHFLVDEEFELFKKIMRKKDSTFTAHRWFISLASEDFFLSSIDKVSFAKKFDIDKLFGSLTSFATTKSSVENEHQEEPSLSEFIKGVVNGKSDDFYFKKHKFIRKNKVMLKPTLKNKTRKIKKDKATVFNFFNFNRSNTSFTMIDFIRKTGSTTLLEAIPHLCKDHAAPYISFCAKDQFLGDREISILKIVDRLKLRTVESLSELISSFLEDDNISNRKKHIDQAQAVSRHIELSKGSDRILEFWNLDKSRWGPSLMVMHFADMFKVFFKILPDKNLKNLVKVVRHFLLEFTRKVGEVPVSLLGVWSKASNREKMSGTRFWNKVKKDFFDNNKVTFDIFCGMMQGLLQATSSVFHCLKLFVEKKAASMSEDIAPFSEHNMATSDDTLKIVVSDSESKLKRYYSLSVKVGKAFNIKENKKKNSIHSVISELNQNFNVLHSENGVPIKEIGNSFKGFASVDWKSNVMQVVSSLHNIACKGVSLISLLYFKMVNYEMFKMYYGRDFSKIYEFEGYNLTIFDMPIELGGLPWLHPVILKLIGGTCNNFRLFDKESTSGLVMKLFAIEGNDFLNDKSIEGAVGDIPSIKSYTGEKNMIKKKRIELEKQGYNEESLDSYLNTRSFAEEYLKKKLKKPDMLIASKFFKKTSYEIFERPGDVKTYSYLTRLKNARVFRFNYNCEKCSFENEEEDNMDLIEKMKEGETLEVCIEKTLDFLSRVKNVEEDLSALESRIAPNRETYNYVNKYLRTFYATEKYDELQLTKRLKLYRVTNPHFQMETKNSINSILLYKWFSDPSLLKEENKSDIEFEYLKRKFPFIRDSFDESKGCFGKTDCLTMIQNIQDRVSFSDFRDVFIHSPKINERLEISESLIGSIILNEVQFNSIPGFYYRTGKVAMQDTLPLNLKISLENLLTDYHSKESSLRDDFLTKSLEENPELRERIMNTPLNHGLENRDEMNIFLIRWKYLSSESRHTEEALDRFSIPVIKWTKKQRKVYGQYDINSPFEALVKFDKLTIRVCFERGESIVLLPRLLSYKKILETLELFRVEANIPRKMFYEEFFNTSRVNAYESPLGSSYLNFRIESNKCVLFDNETYKFRDFKNHLKLDIRDSNDRCVKLLTAKFNVHRVKKELLRQDISSDSVKFLCDKKYKKPFWEGLNKIKERFKKEGIPAYTQLEHLSGFALNFQNAYSYIRNSGDNVEDTNFCSSDSVRLRDEEVLRYYKKESFFEVIELLIGKEMDFASYELFLDMVMNGTLECDIMTKDQAREEKILYNSEDDVQRDIYDMKSSINAYKRDVTAFTLKDNFQSKLAKGFLNFSSVEIDRSNFVSSYKSFLDSCRESSMSLKDCEDFDKTALSKVYLKDVHEIDFFDPDKGGEEEERARKGIVSMVTFVKKVCFFETARKTKNNSINVDKFLSEDTLNYRDFLVEETTTDDWYDF